MYDFQKFYADIQTSLKDAFPEKEFLYRRTPGETITVCMTEECTVPQLNDVKKMTNGVLKGMDVEEIYIAEGNNGAGIGTGSIVVWLDAGQYFSLSREDFKYRDVYVNVGRRCDEPEYIGWQDKYIDLLKRYFGFNGVNKSV